MRRLLLALCVASGCAKTPAPRPVAPAVVPAESVPDAVPVAAEPQPQPCAVLETCLAMVGEVQIPYSMFAEVYDLKVDKYLSRGREIPSSADRRYRKSISERLIHHEMLAQEAKRLGVEYDPARLAEREAHMKRGIRDWEKHLQRRGETEQSLRNMYIAELREEAILEALGRLEITDPEIQADYEMIKDNWKSDQPRVRASHILIPLGPAYGRGAPEASKAEKARFEWEAKALAEEVHAEVTAPGADFAAIAQERSTGPGAVRGGDIGIFTADRMAVEFSRAAFKMKVGEVSKPVRTKFGYHIIKLTGAWPPGTLPIEALEDQIRSRLRQRKLHRGRAELEDDLRRRYDVIDNMKPTLGPDPRPRRDDEPGDPDAPLTTAMR